MATVIDSLVVELGLDPSNFSKGQAEAIRQLRRFEQDAAKAGAQIEAGSRRILDVFGRVRTDALATIVGIFGGGAFLGIVNQINNTTAAAGRFATQMNMSGRDLLIWQAALKQTGGSGESATSALMGMSRAINDFKAGIIDPGLQAAMATFGVGLQAPGGGFKTASQAWLDFADAIQRLHIDPAFAVTFLSRLPGANQDMINFALLGRQAMEGYLDRNRAIIPEMEKQIELAKEYQRNVGLVQTAWDKVWYAIVGKVTPGMNTLLESVGKLLAAEGGAEGKSFLDLTTRGDFMKPEEVTWFDKMLSRITGKPVGGKQYYLGQVEGVPVPTTTPAAAAPPTFVPGTFGAKSTGYGDVTTKTVEDMIRASAIAHGINPEIALMVAKSEGLYNYRSTALDRKTGRPEESYGPFQLYFGSSGGGGLGPEFMRQTGIDPRTDRSARSIQAQIDFSMQRASTAGWGDWHGWRNRYGGAPWAGITRGGGPAAAAPGATSTVNISTINITTQATDAAGIGAEIGAQIRRSIFVAAGTAGAQ